jgi:hypothetical protein
MKTFLSVLAAAVLLTLGSVGAQAQERHILRASVPFAFTVENVSLPAGTYTFSILTPFNVIQMENADGRQVAMVPARASRSLEQSQRTKLVFNRFGDRYVLAEVWEQGRDLHRELRSGNAARNGEEFQSRVILTGASQGSR